MVCDDIYVDIIPHRSKKDKAIREKDSNVLKCLEGHAIEAAYLKVEH